jgi:hypothetical protein
MKLELSQQIFEKILKIKFHKNLSSGSWGVPCGQTNRHGEAKSHFTILQTHLKKRWKRLPSAHRPAPHVMNTLLKFCCQTGNNAYWMCCHIRLQCKNYYRTYCILLTCYTSKNWQGCESGKWRDHNLLLKIKQKKNGLNNVQNCWQYVMSYYLVSHNLTGDQRMVSKCV